MKKSDQRFKFSPWLAVAALTASMAFAATSFIPGEQPLGNIAPAALNQASLASGNVVSYVPWFDFGNYHGDLIAAPVAADGSVSLLTPQWRAAQVLDSGAAGDGSFWDDHRYIVTWHSDGYPTPFRKDDLDDSQIDYLKKDEDKRIKYLRGDRDEEGDKFRVRESLLGDIIHSNPVYVGAPQSGYGFDGYLGYALANQLRAGRLYVGANDGMLHAFDAATGTEVFAYVPTMVLPKLKAYTEEGYTHDYFVDGTLTSEDAYLWGNWHTLLVGGLGAGGKGLFALDVTSADAITDESTDPWGAGSRLLWELTPDTPGAADLGYTYSRPSIVKLNNGKFAVVIGNGYLSSDDRASLMLIDAENGSVIRNIVVSDEDGNGLSSPTAVDLDGDRIVDVVYAGDLNGNLWRFDLSSEFTADWEVAYAGEPILSVTPVSGERRAIVVPPEVGAHPHGGLMVYVATGRLLSVEDGDDTGVHHVYGIYDTHTLDPAALPLDDGALVQQTLTQVTHAIGEEVRTATNNQPDWSVHHGWRTSLEVAGATSAQMGERTLQPISLRGGRLQFVSSNPTDGIGYNWLMQLDAMTGGAPPYPVIDINEDGLFNVFDNADGNGDGETTDVPEDRVVGEFQQLGLASRPVFATIDATGEAVMINHLSQINQIHDDVPPDPPDDEDAGIVGGHFDLDVSSQTYAFDDGETDKHQHEWDDSHNTTQVDFFDVLGGFRSIDDGTGLPGSSSAKRFFINVANAHLSPSAIVEINGIGFPVKEWRALTKRFLAGNMGTNEQFPRFKLGATSPADEAQGIVQLTSLKITFPKNAIQVGGIHPSKTGCVKGNERSPGGVYRNGALTLQMLDATSVTPHYVYDTPTEVWAPPGGSNKIHRLGYAVPVNGVHEIGDGMMYEATIFWHWGGPCYNVEDEAEWKTQYFDETGTDHDTLGSDDDIDSHPPTPNDDGGDDDPESPPPRTETSDANVTNSRVSSGANLGRLYWREILPER